jgi:diguanylate cyclase (GGDEF)-like protein
MVKFSSLPLSARIYIGFVIATGVALTLASGPRGGFDRPLLLTAIVAASIAVHTIKVELPVGASSSTLSLGYAVSFASMLILGPAGTLWATMTGGWAQCTFNTKARNPWYQTAFSMCALSLSMELAAQTLALTGGTELKGPADIVIPSLVASALVYFLASSLTMAIVIGLTAGRPTIQVWDRDFLWGAPNYFVGAFAATVAVQGVSRFGLNSVVALLAPLFLTFRLYKVYLLRVDEVGHANQELRTQKERAEADSLTDPLTQLPNRRFLVTHAEQEIARAARSGEPLAFVMVDVDRFKQINDSYGHRKGDEVLKAVGECLRKGLRPYDECIRYAGDEFVVLMSGCPADLAKRRADALAAAVAAEPQSAGDHPLLVSVSVGVAVFPTDGRTWEDLLAVADARMYQRKHRRVTPFPSPRVEGTQR